MAIRIFERTCIQNFTLPSVSADTTGGGPLDFLTATGQNFHTGILRNFSISCDSTNFSVSLRTKSNATPDTISEIYSATRINKVKNDNSLSVGWVNEDIPITSKLYLVLVNSDPVNVTGEVSVRTMMDINKRFSKNT